MADELAKPPLDDRDQQLLYHLAAIVELARRDQAVAGLARLVAAELRAGGLDTSATIRPIELVSSPPMTTLQGTLVSGDALPVSPAQQASLADNPLAGHMLSMLPMEWQVTLHPIVNRLHVSMRTFVVLVIAVCCLALYTGHVTLPPAIRELVQSTQPKQ